MKNLRRNFLKTALIAPFFPTFAIAQTYPTKPVTIVVPQTTGGTNDAVGRILAQKLAEITGQGFIVENRPGAGGNIGTEYAARAPKDGHTILLTISSTQAINPALYKRIGFDPIKDFEPVASVGVVPNVLVVHPSFPAKNMTEFLTVSRQQKPEYQYASAGNGSLNHLLGAMLTSKTGIPLQHLPYKGVAPALTDLLGGHVPMAFASLPSCIEHVRAGRLRALGVSSAKRSPALPDVEAIGEKVPGYAGELWVAMFAPSGTPQAIVTKLSELISEATASADVQAKFKSLGVEQLPGGPSKLAVILKEDIERWRPIVQASGATID